MHTAPNYSYRGPLLEYTPCSVIYHEIRSPLRLNVNTPQLSKRLKKTPRPLSTSSQLALELFVYLSEYSTAQAHVIAKTLKSIFPILKSDDWEELCSMVENKSDVIKNIYDLEDDVEEEDFWARISSLPDESLFDRMQNLVERIENKGFSTNLNLGVSIEDQEWMVHRGGNLLPVPIRVKRHTGQATVRSADIPLDDPHVLAAQAAFIEEANAAAAAAEEAFSEDQDSDTYLEFDHDYITVFPKDPAAGTDSLWPVMDYHNHNDFATPPTSPATPPPSPMASSSTLPNPPLDNPTQDLHPQSFEDEATQLSRAIAESLRDQGPTGPPPPEIRSPTRTALQPLPNQGNASPSEPRILRRPPKLHVRNPEARLGPQAGQKRKGLCIIYEDPENEPDVDEGLDLANEAKRLAAQRREMESQMEGYRAAKENWEERQLREEEEREREDIEKAIRMSLGFGG